MFKNKIYINTLKIKQHLKKKKKENKERSTKKKRQRVVKPLFPTIENGSRITLKYLGVADQTLRE